MPLFDCRLKSTGEGVPGRLCVSAAEGVLLLMLPSGVFHSFGWNERGEVEYGKDDRWSLFPDPSKCVYTATGMFVRCVCVSECAWQRAFLVYVCAYRQVFR